MAIKIGDRIPSATLMEMQEASPKSIDARDLFAGKKVVLFALPGAFTPTCSAKHLPGFVAHAEALKKKGVDIVACLSVNDAFVMDAWGKAQGAAGKVRLLADGNGEFTKAVGLELNASGYGMGTRSQRYSMLVEDGVVKQLNIEPPGSFLVSSAEFMLKSL